MGNVNLKEWLRKENYEFWNDLQEIKKKAEEIWEAPDHGNYTDHGIEHSEAVIRKLGDLIQENLLGSKPDSILNPYSVFILLASAYLHDIGMQAQKFSKKHESIKEYENWDLESIREFHHKISSEWIREEYSSLEIREEDAYWISRIAEGHNVKLKLETDRFPIEYRIDYQNICIHPRFLAALLRLADALHIAFDRINAKELRIRELPLDSKLEWWLHYYVSGVAPDIKNGFIWIDFRVPSSYQVFWQIFIPKLIIKRIEKDYKSIRDILAPEPYKIPIVNIRKQSAAPFESIEMPPDVFEYMLFYALYSFDMDGYPQRHLELIERAEREKLTLEKFPEAFEPLVIIAGDVREEPPRCAQDLLADSASTADFSWILKTEWHEDTILLSDKFTSRSNLRNFLRNRNLLVIGSPGGNWLSRYIWKKGPFYFEIINEVIYEAKEREVAIMKMTKVDEWKEYKRKNYEELKILQSGLKGDRLYDSVRKRGFSAAPDSATHRGLMSLCEHPFSEDHYAILVGGPRLLGTMAAEKMLLDKKTNRDREELRKRPFGGIVQGLADHRGLGFINAEIEWITREYSFKDLRKSLELLCSKQMEGL